MKLNRNGYSSSTLLFSASITLLLIISLIFGIWAFSSRQNYKNNADQIASKEVQQARAAQSTSDTAKFNSQQQSVLTSYQGSAEYGSIVLKYPKSWSAFINTSASNGNTYPLDAYFMSGYLTSVTDDGTTQFPLRLQVETEPYTQIVQQYAQTSGITVVPYALPKVPSDVGVEITGEIGSNINGTLIVLPLRSQAIEIWTEGSTNLSEFNNVILPNLTFSP